MIKARIACNTFDFGNQVGLSVQLTPNGEEAKRARRAIRFELNQDMSPELVAAQLRALADWIDGMTEDKMTIGAVAAKLRS